MMKIDRAKIDGFGQYSNEDFTFSGGLNVIYGKNEAGKSTLQHFLLAMLYGLKKTGRKRAVYLDAEAKYRPWQGATYGGVLHFTVDGIPYRVERSLRREDEWVRLYRQDTGEDVTHQFPQDSRKEIAFASALLNADRDLFVNTLCIGPVDERERVLHLQESVRHGDGSDTLSTPEQAQVRTAEEAIHKRLDALGTERAASKPLGQALKSLEDAKRLYLEAREREAVQQEARQSAESSTQELQDAIRDEEVLREEFTRRLAHYLNVQQAQLGEWNARLTALHQAIEAQGAELPDIDESAFRELQHDFQQLLVTKKNFDNYQKRLEILETESHDAIAFASPYPHIEDSLLQEVEHTAKVLELLEQKMADEQEHQRDPNDYAAMEKKHKSQRRNAILSGALALVVTPFCLSQWWAVALFVVLLVVAIVSYRGSSQTLEAMETWEEELQDEQATLAAQQEEQARLEARLLILLEAFHVDTPRQYRQKWTQLVKAREQVALYEKQSQWLHSEASHAKGQRDILTRRLLKRLGRDEEASARVTPDELIRDMENWERRLAGVRGQKEQMQTWERERDALTYEVQSVSKELARWSDIAATLGVAQEAPTLFTEYDDVSAAVLERYYQSWQGAERILLEQKASFSEANTRYQTMREGQATSADLLLEVERTEEEWRLLTEERDALQLAADLWAEVKEEMYQAVAPRFASSLSDVTSRLTEGRYGDLYIGRDESIKTVSPDTGYTIDFSSLSQGTMDQLTFALGLSLSGWVIPGGDRLPLLLDEPFRRYDDERLHAVLHVLQEEAKRRQIFLFTCRELEVERLLETGGDDLCVVDLSQAKYGIIKKG